MASTTEPKLIPKSVIFGNPVKANPQISPDGTMMAYLAPVDGVLNIWVGAIEGEDYRPITHDRDQGIQDYLWAGDNSGILYIQDVGGNENYHFYSVDLQSEEVRDLTPFENIRVRMVSHNKDFPNDLLIGLNRDNPQIHDVYNLHVPSGELRLVARNPGNFLGWVADSHFKVRGALAIRPDGGYDLLVRDSEEDEWRVLISWSPEDSRGSGPGHFSNDGRHILIQDTRGVNAIRLAKVDVATGEMEVIVEDPQYDVTDINEDPDTREVRMVAFTRARQEWVVLDDAIRKDIDAVRRLHHGDFTIISQDNADSIWVVMFLADDGPVAFFAYDRKAGQGKHLFDSRPELKNYRLAPMEPISFQSRDGLTIHGYIMFPPGAERKNLPMVLNVHGGPWTRDNWGYDHEAQWLANRGYICLQVNYRGSTGYGKDFVTAGDKEWGGKMHDDLVDAVNWAIGLGYVDPERVAIYGGSYGGYAALVGATFTPDLFCCAVDIVGPSNLISFIETIPPYWQPMITQFHQQVGNPETEAEFLRSRSPLFKVDQIKIPMLIAQGANDPRIKQAESEQIVEAMRSRGIEHQYLLFPDEGHGFAKPENRMKFYSVAEQFLAEHLGGRFE
ncbi:MAG: family peptidase [Chlorobi bacterium]|nr:family peptidase [Chlorobiota bacterium]